MIKTIQEKYRQLALIHPHLAGALVTAALWLAATGLALLLFHFVQEDSPGIAMLYVCALVLIARYTEGYRPGIIAAVASVVFMNYYFMEPYRTFSLFKNAYTYPVTFLCMLAVTLITSTTATNMKRQAAIISEHDKLLMEAEKEKVRANLLRAISHDLRTPLTGIIGNSTSYLENGRRLSEREKRELVRNIYEDSTWLLHMVENLLSVTRIHQGQGPRVTKSLEPFEEVLSEAVQSLKKRLPDANIHVFFPEEFIMVPMDPMLIEQVIVNLLENAVKYSGTDRPIDCYITADETSLSFHVRDYGAGIDPVSLPHIFDGVPQTSRSTADSYRGMGIGLTICKTIITAHGGTIRALNHDCGAEFIFTLPREEEHDSQHPD